MSVAPRSVPARAIATPRGLPWADRRPVALALLVGAQVVCVLADAAALLDGAALHAGVGLLLLVGSLWPVARARAWSWSAAVATVGAAHLLAHPLAARVDVPLAAVEAVVVVAALVRLAGRGRERALTAAFPAAPPVLLADLVRQAGTERFAAGRVVVAEGELAQRFYVITAGVAEVTALAEGVEVYLRTLHRGDVFGEVGLLTAGRRTATVRAVSPLEVVTLDDDGFAALVQGSDVTAEELEALLRARSAPPRARDDAVPLPPWTRLVQRVLKHPRARHYNRLIALVLAANLALLGYGLTAGAWWRGDGTAVDTLAVVAQADLLLALLFRQPHVIAALERLATLPSPRWPLRLRWALAKYYHFGGLHVGASLAATAWYLAVVSALLVEAGRGTAPSVAGVVLAALAAVLLVVIVVMAAPRLRALAHDGFEVTHRFFGWASLVLVWVSTVLLVLGRRGEDPAVRALATAPTVWLLLATTVCVGWPWLRLRRVPVTVERPSSHVGVTTLHYEVSPGVGTTRAVSRRPLVGWHQFANVPRSDGEPGHRMLVSRAGDWTAAFIDEPPTHVWVRGVPTVEMANVERLFAKVVYVVTGRGIAPALGHLLGAAVPTQLVWVTRNPRATYGDALVDEILAAQPDASVWDTDEKGKPDVLRLAYGAYQASGAEAVICISNPAVTWSVVHELERRGIPAFGPIWDS